VSEIVFCGCMAQYTCNLILSDEVGEGLGAVCAVQGSHGAIIA
jgi:hypothetical protein